ncbi:MAG: helicase-related protein, partial [Porticoccus sp.]
QKPALLIELIHHNKWGKVLVFTKTKKGANQLVKYLHNEGINAAAIHSDKSQAVRTKTLSDFKNGSVKILVATDIAARGLDIDQLPQVVNFDLPIVAEDYVHRIGRTGRAGLKGQAVSLVSADEFKQLTEIERLIKRLLTRKLVDGFEPNHNIPESKLDLRLRKPRKPKKPKKPKPEFKDRQRSGESPLGDKPSGKNKKRTTGKHSTGGKPANKPHRNAR